jgi:hypothetical protein
MMVIDPFTALAPWVLVMGLDRLPIERDRSRVEPVPPFGGYIDPILMLQSYYVTKLFCVT